MQQLTLTFAEIASLLAIRETSEPGAVLARVGLGESVLTDHIRAAGLASLYARELVRLDSDGTISADPALAAVMVALEQPVIAIAATVSDAAGAGGATTAVLRSTTGAVAVEPRGLMTYGFVGVSPTADPFEVVGRWLGQVATPGSNAALQAETSEGVRSVAARLDDGWTVTAGSGEGGTVADARALLGLLASAAA